EPDLVAEAYIHVLDTFSVPSSDLPGIKAYKAGWINMVFFATLDLLRCEALLRLSCDRTVIPAGVVLGWAHEGSTGWEFDCGFRHAWEPPQGFTEAYLGGTCSDPARLYRDEVEAILAAYSPPEPPATPPTSGGHKVPPKIKKCLSGQLRVGNRCISVIAPGKKIPDKWRDEWRFRDPKEPLWNPPDYSRTRLDKIYQVDEIELYGDGLLHIADVLGYDADATAAEIRNIVKDGGGKANVLVIAADEVKNVEGYLPASSASPSDQILLTADATGRVIATGRVAAVHSAREVSTLAPQISEAVATAASAASETGRLRVDFTAEIAGVTSNMVTMEASLGLLQSDLGAIRGTSADYAVTLHRLLTLEQQLGRVDVVAERVAKLEGKALAQAGDLGAKTYTVDVANQMAEYAQTATQAMLSIDQPDNKHLVEYVAEVERKQGELELAVRGGDPESVAGATVELLDSMRTMIGGAGVASSDKRKLDAQFRAMKGLLG
ncbi:MAG TPA: hypothetical protein VFD20_06625, partial [Demequina sp.]|nr:hypothetical protein [Demequina sp.]